MRYDLIAIVMASAAITGVAYLWSSARSLENLQALETNAEEHFRKDLSGGDLELTSGPSSDLPRPASPLKGRAAPADADFDDRLDDLLERVAHLESKLAGLVSENTDRARKPEEVRAREADIVEEEASSAAENYRRLDDKFVNEIVDDDWSAQVLADLGQAIAESELLQRASLTIECRATLCRIEADSGAYRSLSLHEIYKALPELTVSAPTAFTFTNPRWKLGIFSRARRSLDTARLNDNGSTTDQVQ